MDTQEKEYQEFTERKSATEASSNGTGLEKVQRPVVQDDEIDLAELFKQIWKRKKILLYTLVGALVIGVFIAAVSPEEYTAKIVLMPQSESGAGGVNNGLLGQLSGIAGVNLSGGGNSGLSKTLYPDITQSTPFYLSLMEQEVYFSSLDSNITLYHYFTKVKQPPITEKIKKYTFGLPRLIIRIPVQIAYFFSSSDKDAAGKSVNDKSIANVESDTIQLVSIANKDTYTPIELKSRQLSVISSLKSRILTTIEPTGMVSVSAEMPDPVAAAKLTELAVEYLTNYIVEY
ncbi:MAG: Wzz/FepE/Etk N-terminal domain-containing protein, partial [Cyclobacteriaceae bacterium]